MKYLIGFYVLLFLLFVLLVGIPEIISNNQCRNLCEDKGAMLSKIIPNGELNLREYCQCIFKYKIITTQLDGRFNIGGWEIRT